jgi:hypothetical protein
MLVTWYRVLSSLDYHSKERCQQWCQVRNVFSSQHFRYRSSNSCWIRFFLWCCFCLHILQHFEFYSR